MAPPALEKLIEDIKAATHELLKNPDFAKNTLICDTLARHPDFGSKALDTLKKRLTHKNAEVAGLALTILDMLVKNVQGMHHQIASKSFLKAVVKLTDPNKAAGLFRKLDNEENMLRLELKERALVLIESWAKGFGRRGAKYRAFVEIYDRLKKDGVKFPNPTVDETAPVFTPPPNRSKKPAPKATEQKEESQLTDRDCKAANETATLLVDMLTASVPGTDLTKADLIQSLLRNVKAAQARCVGRIQQGPSASLLSQLLKVNDVLLDAIQYYEGLRSGKMQRRKPKPAPKKEDPKPEPKKVVPALVSPDKAKDKKKKKKKKKVKKENSIDDIKLDDDQINKSIPMLSPPAAGRSRSPSPQRMLKLDAPPETDKKKKKKKKKKKRSDSQSPAVAATPSPAAAPAASNDPLDLLDFSLPVASSSAAANEPASNGAGAAASPPAKGDDILDIFGSIDLSSAPQASAATSDKNAKADEDEEDDDDPFLALAQRDIGGGSSAKNDLDIFS